MILVDTSVWVDHFRQPSHDLQAMLAAVMIVHHPFVTGELSLGSFKKRDDALALLLALPSAVVASETDFLTFVANERMAGSGIGFVDAHLLATCRLMPGTLLWSRDRRLERWAVAAGVAWSPR